MNQASTKKISIPDEINGWNWGAFILTWIWGIANKTYISLLALIPGVNIVISVILGIKGNKLAWQNREWSNIDEFKYSQTVWTFLGIGAVIGFILGLVTIIIVLGYVISNVFL